ncbi:MAG: zinc-ribbon domain-containing protein [Haloarculaceae archaeon]
MPEAWIQLQCPNCQEVWELNPADLPAPDRAFTCSLCGATFPTSEFERTQRGLRILESFHGR